MRCQGSVFSFLYTVIVVFLLYYFSILAAHLCQKTGSMPFSALILVEMTSLLVPTGDAGKMERKGLVVEGMAEASKKKKDKWGSRADAKAWMARRMPWKAWDARALDLFVVRTYVRP